MGTVIIMLSASACVGLFLLMTLASAAIALCFASKYQEMGEC